MLGLVGAPRLKIVRWQTWRAALRENHKEKHGESENDADAVSTVARGKLRSQQQGCPRVSGQPGHHGSCRSEEEWRVRAARHRPSGTRGPQSSHGAQPGDWRGHQDRGQEGREVPRGQEREGLDRSAEEGQVVDRLQYAVAAKREPRDAQTDLAGLFCFRISFCLRTFGSRDELSPTCGPILEAYACFFSSTFSSSPFKAVLKLRIPSPKPFATSGIFLPPNNSTATPRITRSSGKPIDFMRPPFIYKPLYGLRRVAVNRRLPQGVHVC